MRKLALLTVLLAWAPLGTADNRLELDEYAGQVVVVDFWASWCVPCRRSFPWMNAMQDRYQDEGLRIIAVNLDRDSADAERFLAAYPHNFRIAYDPDGNVAKEYGVVGMPSSIVIGRDGQVFERHTGFKVRKQDNYEATLRAALGLEDRK